ncbi:SMP-30/gluconolactonase/LRE family protein [Saccharospirillum mangrovi]|uniref:SMP-30/gluconolactonase/LRE family protein n=1 Tax=Saccharospirillum mangrovi TaxID=2161747 RepID=UPI000D3BB9FA|nr:SMP-30/gluconolactonase/LRE family protein [Saccharospirillum mangrovi]
MSAPQETELELLFSLEVANHLGEGVQWHAPSQTLWWTDIHESQLFRFDWASQTLTQWQTPDRLTSFSVLDTNPIQLLVSFARGFALYQPHTQTVDWLAQPELDRPNQRFNDGRVDPQGRFWAGTMQDTGERQPLGSLYKLDVDGAKPILSDLTIPNALCWNLAGTVMYHADTPTGRIRQFDFDAATGTLSNERPFATAPRGYPDGANTSADGSLLCALFSGSAVACFDSDGTLQALHPLPVSQPTCVALGGPDGNLLFVTSATEAMSDAQRQREPMAGNLLVYASPYQAKPEPTANARFWPKSDS